MPTARSGPAPVIFSTQLGLMKGATVVPVIAVQQNDQGALVYAVKGRSAVAKVRSPSPAALGDKAVISDGVRPGDHVVIDGQLRLTDGAPVKETSAGKPASTADAGAKP